MLLDVRLGEILRRRGLVTEAAVAHALATQIDTGEPLGEILVREAGVSEEAIAEAVADQRGIPYVRLTSHVIDRAVLNLVPEEMARRLKVLPLFHFEDALTVAMAEPANVQALEQIRKATGLTILPAACSKGGLLDAIARFYRVDGSFQDVIGQFEVEKKRDDASVSRDACVVTDAIAAADDTPVVALLNLLIVQAIRDRASDIHIEPDVDCLRIRYRVDGVLREVSKSSRDVHPALISRLKILCQLDVTERRHPQDGAMSIRLEGKPYDLRVSTLPTILGEKAVIRVLDKGAIAIGLEELGFPPSLLETWRRLIRQPDGIVLVTGPTGSGKTSTLYASLGEINALDVNIVTVEDPVEYGFPIINQVQTNAKAGIGFAGALRSILRQDPDIVMIGEIRDLETAEIAIRAALTGHLVLSTLHTNDTATTITRLVDMGIPPYLVSASLHAVLAQRLVRRICVKCRARDPEPRRELLPFLGPLPKRMKFWKGAGCQECRGSGYLGRVGLFELLVVNDEVRSTVNAGGSIDSVRAASKRLGFGPLVEDGIAKISDGGTTIEEVVRVTRACDPVAAPPARRAASPTPDEVIEASIVSR